MSLFSILNHRGLVHGQPDVTHEHATRRVASHRKVRTRTRIAYATVAVIALGVSFSWSTSQAANYSEWSEPVNLGATVNSPAPDIAPTISKNELSLYFSSTRPGGSGGFDIWVSQRARRQDPWGPPQNLGAAINTASNDQGTALSRDGHLLFFVSDRPGGYGGQDIWVSWRAHTRDDFAWQPPVNLGAGVNSDASDHGPGYFENDDDGVPLLYFGSDRSGGLGLDDIYVARLTRQGSFAPPTLVAELSTPDADVGPDVRRDGREMYLHSNRPGSFGLFDIWVSTRERVSEAWSAPKRLDAIGGHRSARRHELTVWAEPANLGVIVNTTFAEGQPAISSDRKTLFFFSNRPGGVGSADLYVTTRTHLRDGDNDDADRR
jgi:Tol biopolymer transport system component